MIHLLIPDPHARPGFHNKRAEWLGSLILDVKPDIVIEIGDLADMPSLASFDKGKKNFIGRTYKADIESAIDFNDRLWGTVKKAKKSLPKRYKFIGNHEERINKAINLQPELEGTISLDDLQLDRYYDEIIPYDGNTPGVKVISGISYAHYHASGVMGRPIGGEHPGYMLLTKKFKSCTQGHTHILDHCVRTNGDDIKIHGLVCGVYQDYRSDWAGKSNDLWWSGVVVKRGVEGGVYSPQFISLEDIKKEYS